ncbi:MAG: hypothetical protein K6T73_01320 [Candidatus Bathyarchaeota archaeon]|nr:hypothetical protein [Candidatus Bathyarchaeota archaeon]
MTKAENLKGFFLYLAIIILTAIASFEAGIIYESKRIMLDNPTLVAELNTKLRILWAEYLEKTKVSPEIKKR